MKKLTAAFERALPVANQLNFRLALVLAVALLPLMIVSILRSQSVISEAEARSQAALVGETLRAVQDEVTLIERAKGATRALSILLPTVTEDSTECSALMREIIRGTPFSFAGYYDLTGFVPCSSAEKPFSLGMTSDLKAQIANPVQTVLVNEYAPISKTSVIYASYPVFDADGTLKGFAAVSVPHSKLTANENFDIGATFLTVKSNGTVLTGPATPSEAEGLLPVMEEGETLGDMPSSFIRRSRDGDTRVYSITPLVAQDLFALGTWTELEDFQNQFYFTNPALFPVLMWLASLSVAWFASRLFVTQHVLQLRAAMRKFSDNRAQSDMAAFRYAPIELRDVAGEFVSLTDHILHEEARLEDEARQKEVLLREVHHRVKNNLQLIASIMSMQMRQSRSPEVKALIRSLHDRVNSLATVHRDLYQTSGQVDVSIDELLRSIVSQVVRMGTRQGDVQVQTELDVLRLNPDQAVPLSLFVTEALTNALKYIGARDGNRAALDVRLAKVGTGDAVIEISNTLPAVIVVPDAEKSSGLGSDLMTAFGAQLEGEVERLQTDTHFTIRLQFPIEELAAKPETE